MQENLISNSIKVLGNQCSKVNGNKYFVNTMGGKDSQWSVRREFAWWTSKSDVA